MAAEVAQLRIPRSASPVPTTPKFLHRVVPVSVYALGAASLIAVLLGAAIHGGWFLTSGKVDASGNRIELTASSSGGDLKGWMTIQQVLDAFGVSKAEFYDTFGLPADLATDEKLGPLGESVPGFALEDVRTWLDLRAVSPASSVDSPAAEDAIASSAAVVPTATVAAPEPSHTPSGTPSPVGTPTEEPARDGTGSGNRGQEHREVVTTQTETEVEIG